MSPFLMIKGCIVNNPKNCTRVYLVHHGLGTENPHFHFAVWQGVRKLTIFSAIQDESTRGMTFRREDIICFSSFLVGCNVNVPQALLPGAWNQTELHGRSRHKWTSCLKTCVLLQQPPRSRRQPWTPPAAGSFAHTRRALFSWTPRCSLSLTTPTRFSSRRSSRRTTGRRKTTGTSTRSSTASSSEASPLCAPRPRATRTAVGWRQRRRQRQRHGRQRQHRWRRTGLSSPWRSPTVGVPLSRGSTRSCASRGPVSVPFRRRCSPPPPVSHG